MGIFYSILIFLIWGIHLFYSLEYVNNDFKNPFLYLHIIIQGYLFTGLFITSHDAMHSTVSSNRFLNNLIGRIACFLFAGFSYNRLLKNHRLHHKYPCTENDPDYCIKSQNFFIWFGNFIYRYVTILQIITVAIIFNLLKLLFNESSVWLFYVIPAFLGTLQLFYFGTYRPHRKPHTEDMEPHKARTMKNNHIAAMLSCYFFGYHSEHHTKPHIPWWQLYKTK